MCYLVLLHLESGFFGTDKEPLTPKNTYGETYEPSQRAEAYAYFWQSLVFAIEHRKELNESGAGDYIIILAEMESETSETPKREIYRLKVTPSGAVAIYTENEAEIIQGLRRRLESRYLMTEEPITAEQKADIKRIIRPIPKA